MFKVKLLQKAGQPRMSDSVQFSPADVWKQETCRSIQVVKESDFDDLTTCQSAQITFIHAGANQ